MKPVLLLVDLQADFLASAGLQPAPEAIVSPAAELLRACRRLKLPVIHIWTTLDRKTDGRLPHWKKNRLWQCVAGTPGHRTPASLQPQKTETIIHKTGFNGFAGGALDATLIKFKADTIIVAGIHLHTCVRTVAAEGLERGLQVLVSEDAVGSNDPVFAATTRRWLAGRCVDFLPVNHVVSRLEGKPPSKLIHRSPRVTKKILFEIPVAGTDEISAATASAHSAGTSWRSKNINARCTILEAAAHQLEVAAPALARQMAMEVGKPIAHGLEEVRRAAASIRDVCRRARAFEFLQRTPVGWVRHEPLGVIALISPWNNPVAIPVGKIAPALVYGNAIVWKPAPAAQAISETILKLLRESGVPKTAVQIVSGDHTTAQKLAADEKIAAVTITSSAQAGHAIQEICARRFLPLQAELSGNNAAIVWDDADLRRAAKQIVWGAFGFAGQRCTANRRVIVSTEIFGKFWRQLKLAAEKLSWGDPLEKSTDIGPVIHTGKRVEHREWVRRLQASGASYRIEFLFARKAAAQSLKLGAYAQPVMVACDEPDHPLVQEETMSPLLIVQQAKNFEQALKLCNGVRHGLVAALFSESPKLQKRFMAGVQAGMLKINSATAGVDVSLPFGGWKMSGFGPPEHGDGDRLFYTRMQAVYGATE